MEQEKSSIQLPENAFRELLPNEEYKPILSPDSRPREVTPWSVTWGLLMAVLFSAAAAYLGLRVGQVFEAAIPIAIIAVGLSSATHRKNALGENVIIQSIGACSGVVVAGAIFTLPALYIIQAKYPNVTIDFIEVFLSSLLGGILGILFLIPFRKFFVKDQHGKYPFPEATATTQVLVSGEKGGSQAKPLLIAGIVGGVYDFLVATFGTWTEACSTRAIALGAVVAEKTKLVFSINTSAAVLGLGYIVGLKYAAIICAGSAVVWFVVVPIMPLLGDQVACMVNPTFDLSAMGSVSAMSPEDLFKTFGRHIGIGGIAMAGLIGIIKQWGIIRGAVALAGRELKGSAKSNVRVERTNRDIPMKIVAIGVIVAIIATFIFFYVGVVKFNLLYAIVGILVIGIIAFLFTTVAANAIAIVGTNPVSGMTLMTLILASIIMVAIGLRGSAGMITALIMGGVVCTALSTAGGFITDLKIGYWLGTTPLKQETWKFLGILVSAVTVGGVMILLNKTYGFVGEHALVAPQANAMAAVIEPMMSGSGAPWILYGIGAIIALLLNWAGIPALAFALGMFIPMELNAPLLVGGAVNWFVTTRTKDPEVNNARGEKGTLIASGFIAGGALMGVVSALLRFMSFNPSNEDWLSDPMAEMLSFGAYLLLICYFIIATRKK